MGLCRFVQGRTTGVVAGASVLTLLGGVGGAVAHGMIDSGDIANQSIRAVDIQKGGVGKAELRQDSVGWFGEINAHTRQKIRSLAGEDGAVGAPGPAGPRGFPGPPGPQGEAGPAVNMYRSGSGPAAGRVAALCDAGDWAIGGGGYAMDDESPSVFAPLGATMPLRDHEWVVYAADPQDIVEAWVTCEDRPPYR